MTGVRTLTVSALNEELERLLNDRYRNIIVEGEVAQITVAASGHAYISLRDRDSRGQTASLSAVCWRDTWRNQRYHPEVGERVHARGRVGHYSPRGNVQLHIHQLSPAGEGALAKDLAARHMRLMTDGLFDPDRKRPLPATPKFIGVATSLRGAALQDFLKVSRERFPAARILVAGCTVQGDFAAAEIIQALELLIEDGRSQIIILTRGGGSKEDLLAFYDEQLVRYLAASPIPTISAVGHEVDTTFCCMVADAYAPTPTAAAVKALPDGPSLAAWVDDNLSALEMAINRVVALRRERVVALQARLRHPQSKVTEGQRRITDIQNRLHGLITNLMAEHRAKVLALDGQLNALSPTNVLNRGYAIVSSNNDVISRTEQATEGQTLSVRVSDGKFDVEVLG